MSDIAQHGLPRQAQESTQEVPGKLESLEDWDNLPLYAKKKILDAIIVRHRSDVEQYTAFLHDRDWNSYMLELSYLSGMVSLAETEENINTAIARIATIEETLAIVMPRVMRAKAESLVSGLEKGMVVAPGFVPPDLVREVNEKLDETRQMLISAQERPEFEQVLGNLLQIQEMLKPKF